MWKDEQADLRKCYGAMVTETTEETPVAQNCLKINRILKYQQKATMTHTVLLESYEKSQFFDSLPVFFPTGETRDKESKKTLWNFSLILPASWYE